jgi:putative endonuclease
MNNAADHAARTYARGQWAETLACWWLRAKGYRVVARRLRTPAGEIDIAVQRGSVLVVVEVKARPSLDAALIALAPRQRHRLARAGAWLLAQRHRTATELRFDMVLVCPWRRPHHVVDAWRP